MRSLQKRLRRLDAAFQQVDSSNFLGIMMKALHGDRAAIAEIETMRRAGTTPGRLIELYDAIGGSEAWRLGTNRPEDQVESGQGEMNGDSVPKV